MEVGWFKQIITWYPHGYSDVADVNTSCKHASSRVYFMTFAGYHWDKD